MTLPGLVARVLSVEIALVGLTLAAIFGRAHWRNQTRLRRAVQVEQARAALITILSGGDEASERVLRGLPRRVQEALLIDIAPSLGGPQRTSIIRLADELGITASACASLRSRFWWRRLHGARVLTLVGDDVAALDVLARDPNPMVRAQRVEALGQHPSAGTAEELIAMLGDPDGSVSYAAMDCLMRLGAHAQRPVAQALAQDRPPALPPLLDVAAAIPTTDFLAPALRHSASETPAVRVRAVKVLRAIGAPAGVERLAELLGDPSAEVRITSAAALGSLAHWPAASAIARLLDDDVWEVRTAASVALQRLGAPGELLLRRARSGSGAGAEVARQVLEVAERLRIPGTA